MIGLVVVAHFNLAREMVAATELIVGEQEQFAAVDIFPNDPVEKTKEKIVSGLKNSDTGDGVIILTDRYTTSNALHQGSKLPEDRRSDFFNWLYDFEFRLMELPKPDIVIYMDIEAEKAAERIKKRQAVTGTAADIHERNLGYLRECARCGAQAAEYYGWRKLSCFHNGAARSEEEIHEEIREILSGVGVKRHEP